MMTTLHELRQHARENLDEAVEYGIDEIGDTIHELADGLVPVYTSDLMQLAADNLNLATDAPELGPAFDGSPTPSNIVAANVYEWLSGELWEYARELEIV